MQFVLPYLTLLSLAINSIEARPNTCAAQPQSSIGRCILKHGREYAATYCSSILSPSGPPISTKTRTVTENVTQTTKVITVTDTPPVTSTISKTKAVNATEDFTRTKLAVTGTTTTYIDTLTTTSTSISIVLTCPPTASVSGTGSTSKTGPPDTMSHNTIGSHHTSMVVSSSAGSNLSITAHRPPPTTAHTTSCSYEPIDKRQTQAVSSPYCLKKFARKHGDAVITEACECLDIKASLSVTTTTITSTTKVDGTTTITPTVTTKRLTTISNVLNSTTTTTENTIQTISATSTRTIIETSRITMSSPTPTSFYIYYSDSQSNNRSATAHFFGSGTSPGGDGIVLAPEAAADVFSLDTENRLIDGSDGNQFLAKNTNDLYPFELLRTKAISKNIPICSACGGVLTCNYPGTTGNTFALCYGYLALGPKDVFGKDSDDNGQIDCVPIDLLFK